MRKILILPDCHLPLEDRKIMRSVIKFAGEYQPDEIVQLGDLMDFPQPSRWSKDTADEFKGSVFLDCEYAKERFLKPLRDAYDGPVGFIEGNHDERPRVYLSKYAPALAESKAFHIDTLLDFERYKITWLPDFYDFTPGWTITHGHRGGIRLSQVAGATALNGVKRFGQSVICGHTHRAGIIPSTMGKGGDSDVQFGVEIGHLTDMKLQTYLKGGTANWQHAFCTVVIDGDHVSPRLHYINQGKFVVDDRVFTVR